MPKEPLVDRIYEALLAAAHGERYVTIRIGVAAGSAVTNMPRGLVEHWLDTMATLGMIQMDGVSIWLTQNYGPRPVERSPEERAILDAQKVPPKAEAAFRKKAEKLSEELKKDEGDKP
jgi:hypothetical protein